MLLYKNICHFGRRLKKIRNERFKGNPKKFYYCKSQELFLNRMSEENPDEIKTRQVFSKWEKGEAVPNLAQFALLCDLLECDPDYLLGKQGHYNDTVEKISKYTGLDQENVFSLHVDNEFSNFINSLVFCEKFTELYHQLNTERYNRFAASDLLQHFNEDLLRIMKRAFAITMKNTSAFSDRAEFYRKELQKNISPETYSEFLSQAISPDYKEQIKIKLKYQNEREKSVSEYDVFIDMMAEVSFEPLLYNYEKEQRIGRLSQMFSEIVEDYFSDEIVKLRMSIRSNLH